MADFKEVVETIRAEEASVAKLFGGDGVGARRLSRSTPVYLSNLKEAANIYAAALNGSRWDMLRFQEAMTTSDFPNLFADILDRQLLSAYRIADKTWPQIAQRKTVNDFRTVKRFPYQYGASSALAVVPMDGVYPEDKISDTAPYTYAVQKYGRRLPFAFETITNDDLDALKDAPDRFARACTATEEKFATQLYVGATGPNTSFFTDGNKNIMSVAAGATAANPVLSIAALQDAWRMLMLQKDPDGNPIVVTYITLVVGPALYITAKNILEAFELWLVGAEAGATANQQLHVNNWMKGNVKLVMNPWIPTIATTGTYGATSWWLFADAANGNAALEMGFLKGYEEPQIFMKAPNAQMVGGGMANVMAGDFDTDSIQYKVRHIFGGATIDPKLALGSTGQAA